jgi:protein-disulfide isomerase
MIVMAKDEKTSRQNLIEKIVPILIVLSIGLAFMVGILWQRVSSLEKGGVAPATTTTTTATQQQAKPTISIDTIKGLFSKDLLKFGDGNRKVLFVEIADPSCPYCHAADGANHSIYKSLGATFQLKADGGSYIAPVTEMKKLVDAGQASYTYIYYPGHGNGEMGMKALYCAQEKGKFWEARELIMSDAGYTLMNTTVQNDKTKSGVVADFLKSAVDANFIKSCLDSGKYDGRLTTDQALALELGIQGTPGFFVNTTNFSGAYSYTSMKTVVDAVLK